MESEKDPSRGRCYGAVTLLDVRRGSGPFFGWA